MKPWWQYKELVEEKLKVGSLIAYKDRFSGKWIPTIVTYIYKDKDFIRIEENRHIFTDGIVFPVASCILESFYGTEEYEYIKELEPFLE